jgi:hypothetical protein
LRKESAVIDGAHGVVYSKDAERDRAFFRDVLKFPHVDAGHDWLIFKLPPSKVAMHPSDENDRHELYLICDDLGAEVVRLKNAGVACDAPTAEPWGVLTHIRLPGGRTDRTLSALPLAPVTVAAPNPLDAVLFAAAKPIPREILARVAGRDCALDLVLDDLGEDLRGRPIELVRAGGASPFTPGRHSARRRRWRSTSQRTRDNSANSRRGC